MFKKQCKYCGKDMFRKKKSEASRKNWLFCSRSCYASYYNKLRRLKPITKKCLYCNKEFEVRTKRERGFRFCSRRCSMTWLNKTEEHKKKVPRGEKCWHWKGGKTLNKIAHTIEWRKWRKAVFERDNYTCQECGQVGGRLNAHHIKEVLSYPKLVFNIDNGRTLCFDCHKKTDNWGIKAVWKQRFA